MLRCGSRRVLTGALIITLAGVAAPSAHTPPAGATLVAVITRLTKTPAGIAEPMVSGNGSTLVFVSRDAGLPGANGTDQVYAKTISSGAVALVSRSSSGTVGNKASSLPVSSPTGRFVAYVSAATNLTPGDDNDAPDVFLRDRDPDSDGVYDEPGAVSTVMVSLQGTRRASFGVEATVPPAVSADARYVAFTTDEAFAADDENDDLDVYVKDLGSDLMARISVSGTDDSAGGGGTTPAISADGRFVAFASRARDLLATPDADTLSDVFVADRDIDDDSTFDEAGTTSVIKVSVDTGGGPANGASTLPALSADGSHVAFVTAATDLVTPAQPGLVVRNLDTATSSWASPAFGTPDGTFGRPALSADGNTVAYPTTATNLDGGDTNGVRDIYAFSSGDVVATRVSAPTNAAPANGASTRAGITDNGRTITFASAATNLVSDDTNAATDAFARALIDDSVVPVVTMVRPSRRWNLDLSSRAEWTATDPAGVDDTDLQVAAARWDRSGSTWQTVAGAGPRSYTLDPNLPGRTYCWRARATDAAGNISDYTTARCAATPVTAATLRAGSAWQRVAVRDAYRDALLRTTTRAATASLAGVRASHLALVATTCSTCGSVRVRWNGTVVATVSLVSGRTQRSRVFEVASFTGVRTGTLSIEATSPTGRTVAIEGIGVFQGPA